MTTVGMKDRTIKSQFELQTNNLYELSFAYLNGHDELEKSEND